MNGALVCRTGNGCPRTLDPGVAVYVWTAKGLRAAWAASKDVLARAQPPIVILHGPPSSITSAHFAGVVAEVRAVLPNARIWLGVGGDGFAAQYRAGKVTAEQVIAPLVACALVAAAFGFELILWDFEAAWKLAAKGATVPDVRSREQLYALAKRVITEAAKAAPDAIHGIVCYDIPTLHRAFPWAAFFVDTAVSLFAYMAYSADGTPDVGELLARVAWAQREQEKAEGQGLIPDDVTGVDVPGDVDRVPAIQLHGIAQRDQVTVLAEHSLVLAWTLPLTSAGGRADPSGVEALEAGLRLRAEVGGGPGAVARYQAAHGLVPDKVVGRKTLEKLGVPAPRKALAA